MSVATELTLLANSKQAIKNSINQKGGNITDSTPLADYSTAIDNLPSGGDNSTLIDLIERDITSINIPSGTTEIGNYAFNDCYYLESVNIPDSVTRIGKNSFKGCTKLSNINIPNGVTTIGDEAFRTCEFLTNISLPNSLTTIGRTAFGNMTRLSNITFGSNLTTINEYAFQYDRMLTKVIIPSSVTSIGNQAFANCTGLTSFICLATTPPSMLNLLMNNQTCIIYVPAESVEAYKTASNWSTYADRIQAIPEE